MTTPTTPDVEQERAAFQVVKGELCYLSDEDDQSFGMWCPVTQDYPPRYPEGMKFYSATQLKDLQSQIAALTEKLADLVSRRLLHALTHEPDRTALDAMLAEARREMRERCAKACDEILKVTHFSSIDEEDFARTIRALPDTPQAEQKGGGA